MSFETIAVWSVLLNYNWRSFRSNQIMNNFGYRYLVRCRVSCIDLMMIKISLLLLFGIYVEIADLTLTNITLCIYWSCWDWLIRVDFNVIVGMKIWLKVTWFFLMKDTLKIFSATVKSCWWQLQHVGDSIFMLVQLLGCWWHKRPKLSPTLM